MSTTPEEVEEQRRRLAEMEADLTDEDGSDPIEDARAGATQDDGGFDLSDAIQNAGSQQEVVDLIREHGSEHGLQLAGDLGDVPRPGPLDADGMRDYEAALGQANTQDEIIQVIREHRGYDPTEQQ